MQVAQLQGQDNVYCTSLGSEHGQMEPVKVLYTHARYSQYFLYIKISLTDSSSNVHSLETTCLDMCTDIHQLNQEGKKCHNCLTIPHGMYLETPAHLSVIPTTGAAEADFTGIQVEPGLRLRQCLLSENAVPYFCLLWI